jgi:hypothetical protein
MSQKKRDKSLKSGMLKMPKLIEIVKSKDHSEEKADDFLQQIADLEKLSSS